MIKKMMIMMMMLIMRIFNPVNNIKLCNSRSTTQYSLAYIIII
jgi:hypothetical protein